MKRKTSRQLEQQRGSFVGRRAPGSRDEHVAAIDPTEVWSTGGVDHCGAHVSEVGRTDATDAVKSGSRR